MTQIALPARREKVISSTKGALYVMQERMDILTAYRHNMFATIFHDLLTPITRLKIRAHCFKNQTEAEKIISDLDEMESMITNIIAFARDESQIEPVTIFDLNALFLMICDEIKAMGHTIKISTISSRIIFTGHRLAIKRSIHNLLQNAIRYGKEISTSLRLCGKKVMISIEDRGPGIKAEELEKVFEPYYRGETGKHYSSIGTGLGLASAKLNITLHSGTIVLKNRKKGGLKATIFLPIQKKNYE